MSGSWLHFFKPLILSIPALVLMLCAGLVFAGLVGLLCAYLIKKHAQRPSKPPPSLATDLHDRTPKISSFFHNKRTTYGEKPPLSVGRILTFLREHRWVQSGPIHRSFLHMLKALKTSWGGRNARYRVPWYLMVGAPSTGKSDILRTLQTFQDPILTQVQDDTRLHGFLFHQALVWEWNMGPDPPEDQGWIFFLELLKTYRPRRPLEGVIVILPATYLFEDQATLRRSWVLDVYKTLWSLQKRLGMSVPVQIIVTQSELIPGFQDILSALPERHQDIWGWSSPYGQDIAYDASWSDTFVQDILERLHTLSTTSEAMHQKSGFASSLMRMTYQWRQLGPLWKELLTDIFKPSSLHEPFLLRGIYFTGLNPSYKEEGLSVCIEGLRPSSFEPSFKAPLSQKMQKIWGVRDVFEQKIFLESALARPLPLLIQHQTRSIHGMWFFMGSSSLVLGVGTFMALHQLHLSVNSLHPLLRHISETAQHIHKQHQNHTKKYDRAYLENQGKKMLGMMPSLHLSGLFSIFLPSTWFSDVRIRTEILITHGYDTIVMGGRGLELTHTATLLTTPPSWNDKESQEFSTPAPEVQAFKLLKEYVWSLKNLEERSDAYNTYQNSDSQEHLKEIITFLEARSSFWHSMKHLYTKRPHPHTIHLEPHIVTYQKQVRRLYKNFLKASFLSAPLQATTELLHLLQKLQEILKHGGQRHAWEELTWITQEIDQELSFLQNSGLSWLAQDRFSSGPDYDAMMVAMGQMKLLGKDFTLELSEQTNRSFQEFKKDLQDHQAPLIGHVLEIKDQNLTALPSPDLVQIKTHLMSFLHLKFLSDVEEKSLNAFDFQNKSRMWDPVILQEISQRIEQFESFQKKTLTTYHPLLQGYILKLARQRLQNMIRSMIAHAHVIIPLSESSSIEESVKTQIENFQKNMPVLTQILTFFKQPDLSPDFGNIQHYLRSYALHLAQQSDHMFQKDHLYDVGPDPFRAWQGTGNAALIAFHSPDIEELKYLLTIHKERAGYWANLYLQPLLQILTKPELQPMTEKESFIGKWQKIVEQVQAADKKTPGHSIGAFEHFMLQSISTIDLKNCATQTTAALTSNTDYFAQKLNKAVEALQHRCESALWAQAQESYQGLASLFNTQLAGKVPFIQGSSIQTETKDASWTDVQAFYQAYAQAKPLISASIAFFDPAVQKFLKQTEHVCAFLKPFMENITDDMDPSSFVLNMNVDLKYWPQYGQGLSSIVGWSWSSDAAPVTLYSTDTQAHWHIGQPTGLALEWVASGACVPKLQKNNGALQLASPYEASYAYQGTWSLLRMILKHQATTQHTQSRVIPPSGVLRFVFPTHPKDTDQDADSETKTSGTSETTQPSSLDPQATSCPTVIGFVRVNLSIPSKDKPVPLKIPAFPDHAPLLSASAPSGTSIPPDVFSHETQNPSQKTQTP